MKRYLVTAILEQGYDSMRRGGQRFTDTPREIVVRDADPNQPHGPDEVTPEQFEQIKAERRMKIESVSGRPVNDAAKAEAEAEKAAPAGKHK